MKPHAPFGLPLSADQWLYLVCLLFAAVLYAGGAEPGREPHRAGADRAARPADRGRGDGRQRGVHEDDLFRDQRALRRRRGGLSAIAVGFVSPESFGLALSLSFLVGIVVGGLASLGGVLFGALFIEFVPNLADQLSVSFGESAKALPGAIYGALLILAMAVMPAGVAGALRAATKFVARSR